MAGNLTFAMIKPHAVYNKSWADIMVRIRDAGFSILLGKITQLTKEGAEEFYEEHRGKGFFDDLARITSSGPVWALVLAKTNAVQEWRDTIGATNSAEAEPGTIRHDFGDHNYVPKNAVHGSASDHDAKREINFFFGQEIKLAQKVADIQKT